MDTNLKETKEGLHRDKIFSYVLVLPQERVL